VPTGPPVFSDPLTFTNRFQPFQPGGLKIYTGRKDGETSLIADLYLKDTRTFMAGGRPVEARVLEETEFSGGALIEISRNFFAQADDGSVYYFGELVDEFDGGVVVGHDGSWLVGGATDPNDPVVTADAPDPTLFMPANPEAGDVFKQEDLAPVVDETDTVVATDQMVNTIGGRFTGAIRVLETTVLGDPPETKWYAPGVGAVRGRTKHEEFVLSASTLIP
jgi:hypothetical protein